MKKMIILIITIIIFFETSIAQKNSFSNDVDSKLFKQLTNYGWISFQDNLVIEPEQLFNIHSKSFGLSNGFTMKLIKKKEGENGYNHFKYKEYYNNIPIENSDYSIHTKNGKLISGNGDIYTASFIQNKVEVEEKLALQKCLENISAKEYYWQNINKEQKLRIQKKDSTATHYPKAEKVYIFETTGNKLLLTYKFHINSTESGKSFTCFVDVNNGEILKKVPLEIFCDPTTITTNWYGARLIHTNDIAIFGNSYNLEDNCQGSLYGVYNSSGNIFNIVSNNNNWNFNSDFSSAATSLWCAKQTFSTFKNMFNRDGHDNDDGNLDIFYATGDANNASYHYVPVGDDDLKFGTGNTNSILDDYHTLDIMAHEFTHGITQYEANLNYNSEQGALNESFSDIFGEWVESKIRPNDWLMGADRKNSAGNSLEIRSLISPNTFSDPDTYFGNNWNTSTTNCNSRTTDWCGVHTNSGVQNQMFYFLSVGGFGWRTGQTCHAPNGTGVQWAVSGIGIDKAITIAYRVLCDYLNSGSNYFASRNAWVQAANEIYGECSFEAIQTGKAWDVVGISPPSATDINICGNYGATTSYINKPGVIYLSNNCNLTVSASNNLVQFTSGNKIILKPGFHSTNGSKFRAAISECNYAAY